MQKDQGHTAHLLSPMTSRSIPRQIFFHRLVKKTELFSRFSTVAGERGAADAERDIRGLP